MRVAAFFDRVGRNIIVNPHGRQLYTAAQPLIRGIDSTASGFRNQSLHTAPPLSIATVSGFGRYVLVPILTRFANLPVRLSFSTAEETWAALRAGKADVGFTFKRTFHPALEFVPVYREELVLISAKPLKKFSLAQAVAIPCVTYEEGDWVFSKWFEDVWGRQPKGIRSTCHVDELEEVVAFVKAGTGVSIVPLDAVTPEANRYQLHIYRRPKKRCFNWVFSVTRSSAQPSKTVEAIIAALAGQKP